MLAKALALLMLCVLPVPASFVYEFTGSRTTNNPDDFYGVSFSLVLESPVTTDSFFSQGEGLLCSHCGGVWFITDAESQFLAPAPSQAVVYSILDSISYNFYFSPEAFSTPGSYETILLGGLHDGTLVVRDAIVEDTPEPPGYLLLLSGLAVVIGCVRQSRSARPVPRTDLPPARE
ncbi:MAG: hypothetical protein MUC42_09415 [Bryobacter sp.]|nr:hypothetical protein [Bryobacter sp.]